MPTPATRCRPLLALALVALLPPVPARALQASGLPEASAESSASVTSLGATAVTGAQCLDGAALPQGLELTAYGDAAWPQLLPGAAHDDCDATSYNGTGSLAVEAVVYDDVLGRPAPEPALSRSASMLPDEAAGGWAATSSDLELLLLAPRVHVGVRVTARCGSVSVWASGASVGRLSHWRRSRSGPWSSPASDWVHDNITGLALRLVGKPSNAVPISWACSRALYADGVCHCGCGAWDPDCNASVAGPVGNCSAGRVCNRTGECVDPGWDERVCALRSYGSGDGCQCGCGAMLDPDCRDSVVAGEWYPRALNCPGRSVALCNDSNACTEAWPNCSADKYGDGVCDCRCQRPGGVLDVDCLRTNVSDCDWAMCYQGACREIPVNWTCDISAYDDNICTCDVRLAPGAHQP
eukprot:m51a1_g5243 hypothetical protein (410) ;mRNA; r:15109-16886